MAFDSITNAWFVINLQQTATKGAAGRAPASQKDIISNKMAWVLGTGAGQIQEAYVSLLSIAASGNQVLDLTALTDVLNTAIGFTGIKGIFIQLLGAADLAPDGATAGNACSGITVGNATTAQFSTPIADTATGTITLANREQFGRCNPSAAGWAVDGSHKNLKILNNDSGNAAKVLVGLQGI